MEPKKGEAKVQKGEKIGRLSGYSRLLLRLSEPGFCFITTATRGRKLP